MTNTAGGGSQGPYLNQDKKKWFSAPPTSEINKIKSLSYSERILLGHIIQYREFYQNNTTISEELNMARPTVIRGIESLEQKGMIRVLDEQEDGRRYLLPAEEFWWW